MPADTSRSPIVVVIGGHDPFLMLMRDILESEGYTVVMENVTDHASFFIYERAPLLVILDVAMQTRDAEVGVLREMRRHRGAACIPVLVMSADSRFVQEDGAEMRILDAEVMMKPFALDDLLARVAALIPCHIS